MNFIDEKMKQNDELTSAERQKDERNVSVSTSTFKYARRKLGWKHEKSRYCQFIRDQNKMKRLVFCLKAMKDKDCFEDVIFSDETSVEIQQFTKYCFKKNGSQPNCVYIAGRKMRVPAGSLDADPGKTRAERGRFTGQTRAE